MEKRFKIIYNSDGFTLIDLSIDGSNVVDTLKKVQEILNSYIQEYDLFLTFRIELSNENPYESKRIIRLNKDGELNSLHFEFFETEITKKKVELLINSFNYGDSFDSIYPKDYCDKGMCSLRSNIFFNYKILDNYNSYTVKDIDQITKITDLNFDNLLLYVQGLIYQTIAVENTLVIYVKFSELQEYKIMCNSIKQIEEILSSLVEAKSKNDNLKLLLEDNNTIKHYLIDVKELEEKLSIKFTLDEIINSLKVPKHVF